ncbi:MAG: hypothetical protein EP307_09640, partial [Rhodobacteraceae bacterium]
MLAFIRTVIVIFALSVGTAQAQSQGPREWVSGVESIPIYRQTDATNEALYISSEWANADLDGKTRKDVTCLAVVYAMLQHAQGNLAYRIGQDGTWSDSLGALDKHGVQGERDLAPELVTVQSEIRAGRPLILQGFSRQLGTNHFMLAVGLTSGQEIIAYDPLSGGEVLIPSDTMVAEIAQPGGSVLAFTVMTLRTLNVTLAAEDRPAPVATPEATAGDGDANLLFAEAYRLYARALALPEADQAEAMAEVRDLLKRIADEHPTSRIGARIASGDPLGRMDRDRVFATTEPAREGAVSAELAAPTRTEDQGDPEVMRDWLHRNFPDLLDALDITMAESLEDFETEVTIRAAYLIIMSANHAHDTLGWFEDPRDVAELYRSYVTSGGLSAATTLGKQVGKDMALAIVKDVVASFLTDLTMNALPDFNPRLETLVRTGVKATFLETANAVEAYKNPEKVIWLVLDRAHDMVEIARASKGLADLQDENLLTTALSIQTAAIMLHVHGDDPQARDQAARTITYLDTFMENMVGKDDAQEVKDIFLLGFSALRHLYNGNIAMAEALRSDIIARGDAGNWPSLDIADTFTYLANLGQDAPKRAATIMINATDLAGMDGEGLGAARTNAATTGPGLPALSADADAAPRAPVGSERQDAAPPGPAETSSAWAMGGEGAHLAPGETGLGVDHRADNSIWAFGRQALPPLNQGQGASAYASPSSDDSYRVITQTVDDRQVGWISRLALVPRDPSRPVLSMAPEDVFRFSGQVAWNADGRFAVLEYNHGEFESYALLVDLTTGSVSAIRSDRPASFVSSAVVSSVRSLGGGVHAIDFAHLACPEADPGCGMATIEDAGTTEVTFRLPGQGEQQPVAVAPM